VRHLKEIHMPDRRTLAIVWSAAAFLIMLWSWAFYSGPYRWAAEWQMENFGSYEEKLTLFGPLIVLLIPAGFLGGWGPLTPRTAVTPAAKSANALRTVRIVSWLGVAALLVSATAGALGYIRTQTQPTHASLVLTTGTEPSPAADLVTITGIARTDMIVGYEETISGMANRWSFVPLVSPVWRPGDPIRFVLKTNQNAWMPRAGTDGPHMLEHGSPSFRMITEPSVLKRHALPGAVQTAYDKARIPLDPSIAVVEQSEAEVYAPYWITAALSGLLGFCLLLAGLLGAINARKAARTGPG
jgi:hypothetical protein